MDLKSYEIKLIIENLKKEIHLINVEIDCLTDKDRNNMFKIKDILE